VYAPPLSVGI